MTANLYEAFYGADNADPTDMRNFATRLFKRLPYLPDAVLVSEVVRSTAENVAEELTAASGYDYRVVVGPTSEDAWIGDPADKTKRETAIILNTETMRATDKGGFLRDSVRSGDGELADHAYLGARERRGGLRTALMSAHLDPTQADRALSMRQFAGFIDQTYPDRSRRQVEVIAGDLNWRRCDSAPPESPQPERLESVNCELSPFWPTITGKYGYRDAIFDRHGYSDRSLAKHFTMRQYNIKPNRIDYLFARGAVRAADTDLTNPLVKTDSDKQCETLYLQGRGAQAAGDYCANFYSDHRYVWALVGVR